MSEIKRYNCYGRAEESKEGELCFYEDIKELQDENAELRDFKEFVNMMIRRNLNHTVSDYEALMAIDEKLTGKGE